MTVRRDGLPSSNFGCENWLTKVLSLVNLRMLSLNQQISIVTPSFNASKYLQQAIDSIRNQTWPHFDHVVVDGMSTDGTIEILSKNRHLRWISEKDNGQSDALNKGFKMTTGEILAWQNADDLYLDHTFEIVAKFFLKNPSVGLVYGDYQLIGENGSWICDVHPPKWNKWLFVHGRFVPLQPTVFWRRSVYEKVGELDTSLHYCMDVDFFSRASKWFEFAHIPKVLGQFRVHQESKTQNKSNYLKVRAEYQSVLSRNFSYNGLDKMLFFLFQERKRLASRIKRKFLPRS
jgi:glycosyltransferase involved in cell wall biosynthesis